MKAMKHRLAAPPIKRVPSGREKVRLQAVPLPELHLQLADPVTGEMVDLIPLEFIRAP